jgi:hypothetical protein
MFLDDWFLLLNTLDSRDLQKDSKILHRCAEYKNRRNLQESRRMKASRKIDFTSTWGNVNDIAAPTLQTVEAVALNHDEYPFGKTVIL